MIFDVKKEKGNETSCTDCDKAVVQKILSDSEVTCERVGPAKEKCGPLKVTIGYMMTVVSDILKNSEKVLKDNDKFDKNFITPISTSSAST